MYTRDNDKLKRKEETGGYSANSDCSTMFPSYPSRRTRMPVTRANTSVAQHSRSIRRVQNRDRSSNKSWPFRPAFKRERGDFSNFTSCETFASTRDALFALKLFLLAGFFIAINHAGRSFGNWTTLSPTGLRLLQIYIQRDYLRASFYSRRRTAIQDGIIALR